LPLVEAPDAIWTSIARQLDAPRPARVQAPWVGPRMALALAATLVLILAPLVWFQMNDVGHWEIVRLDGGGRIRAGEMIETDAASNTTIRIGTIGTVELEPNTRLSVVLATPDEHRLNLARGTINAEIIAPPRVFFVETPASTVVDLGCAYTMQVDEAGVGTLRVTSGWASLEWNGRESIVPAGASAHTRPQIGPGTPAFDDASERLREALFAFDFENGGADAVGIVLSESRDRDTLTLWHLLWRVDAALRARVFDRMAALTPLPKGVARDQALALEPETLTLWREELAWTW
jgi:hypothetical protein